MDAYIDASVLLRVAFGEPNPLATWSAVERAVSSALIRTESLRAVDRGRIRDRLDDRTVAARRSAILELLDAIETIPLESSVLDRAGEPFPTSLGTLDALHLASALAARAALPSIVFATHDASLGLAAASMGFEVHGTPG